MLLPPVDLSQGTLIRIGAGQSSDIEALLRSPKGPARVILIEPHPDMAKALAARLSGMSQVTVLASAVTEDGAGGVLNLYSNLAHGSLRAPLAVLFELMPGLRLVGTVPVPGLSVGQMLDQVGQLPRPVMVEIDAPGAEQEILAGFRQSGRLDQVDMIDLRCGAEPLYDRADGAKALVQGLDAEGFRVTVTEGGDPDWPEYRLVADHVRRDLQRQVADLTDRLSQSTVRITALEQGHASVSAKAREQGDLATARATKLAEVEAALAAANTALTAANTAKAAAEAKAKEQGDLATARATKLAEVEPALAAANAAKAAAEAKAKEQGDLATARATKLAEVEPALAAANTALAAANTALAAANTALAAANTAKAAAEAKAKEQGDLATARASKLAEVEAALAKATPQVAEKDAAVKLAADRKTRIESLEKQTGELERKVVLARKELNRAEGQIALISDLLLRGGGL